jgi:hypothetical protein
LLLTFLKKNVCFFERKIFTAELQSLNATPSIFFGFRGATIKCFYFANGKKDSRELSRKCAVLPNLLMRYVRG